MVVSPAADEDCDDPGYQFHHHAGLLLFSSYLNQISNELAIGAVYVKQWLSTILMGAINIE